MRWTAVVCGLAVLAGLSACGEDDEVESRCLETLGDVCREKECPASPAAAMTDSARYPQVLADGDRFVIGNAASLSADEFHFEARTLVGHRSYTDFFHEGDRCPTIVEIGTLHSELLDLWGSEDTCTFYAPYEELYDPCPSDLFDGI